MERLERLASGMAIPYGGDKVARVSDELAAAFAPGDRLIVVQTTGDLLHVTADDVAAADSAVGAARRAFAVMGSVDDDAVSAFYEAFADRLADDATFAPIAAANRADVESARARGRSVTRLILSDRMRTDMVDGLRAWRDLPATRGKVVEEVVHEGWRVEQVVAGLGVVGFVFEGRPNVFADATGVLRGGNTVVFRIGSDALGTARAIVAHALEPALGAAGLPSGAVSLVDSASRGAGLAMFSDPRLSLAVARGSGAAVAQLGAVASQAGVPVSLHGTGGAWVVADPAADADRFAKVVYHSLDRKVCNTLNTCVVVEARAADLVPRFLEALLAAGERRGTHPKLHVAEGSESWVPEVWFARSVPISRAAGEVAEPQAETIPLGQLGEEWEWEDSPEVTLVVVPDVDTAVDHFNRLSPRLTASLVSEDPDAHRRFFDVVDAPFVGTGFTRWVDGQFALGRPELGLSNWERGRLFARGAVLAGDSVFTIRTRAIVDDPDLGR